MLHIIRDGIRRWWWIYALAGGISVFGVFANLPNSAKLAIMAVDILYACLMLFIFEVGSSAKFRTLNMLPVSHRHIALAFGILWLGLVPAFHTAVYLAGALVHAIGPGLAPAPVPFILCGPALFFCVGMACLYLNIFHLSRQFRKGWRKRVWGLFSSCFMVGMYVVIGFFIYRFGLTEESKPLSPGNPFDWLVNGMAELIGPKKHMLDRPELVALGAAALCIVAFILRAEHFTRYLFSIGALQEEDDSPLFFKRMEGSSGFFDPWVQEIRSGLWFAGLFVFTCGVLYLMTRFFLKVPISTLSEVEWPLILIVIASLVCVPPAMPWLVGMRTLRVLPFSRMRLAGYLASFSLFAFSMYSAAVFALCAYFRGVNYAMNMEWWMVYVFGFSLVSVGLLLQARHSVVAAIILLTPAILTVLLAKITQDPVEVMQQTAFWIKAGAGAALVAAGYLLLYIAVARTGAYRLKSWIGAAQR